ncbi:hypothetical protein [Cypionkella sp. TWP1-2-1b2]|uniref:hypothetical protein n=1 Tax=Cypionkella sp. TWP1-2-1b2 TaxID=2804675 RepID=UPI003CEA3EC3
MQRGHREVEQADEQRLIWAMHVAVNAGADDLKRIFATCRTAPASATDAPLDGDIRYL